MDRAPLFVLFGALLACAGTETKPETADTVTTPSGGQGHAIQCEELKDCYAKAGEVCPSGYEVVDTRESQKRATGVGEALRVMGEGIAGEEFTVTDQQSGERATVTKHDPTPEPRMVGVREMLIECRSGPPGKLHQVGTVEPSASEPVPCDSPEAKADCEASGAACRYTGSGLTCVRE